MFFKHNTFDFGDVENVATAQVVYSDLILYASAEEMETALKAEVTKLGISEDSSEVYDVKLLFSLDDGKTWTTAIADNFPSAGITVTLPYPEDSYVLSS